MSNTKPSFHEVFDQLQKKDTNELQKEVDDAGVCLECKGKPCPKNVNPLQFKEEEKERVAHILSDMKSGCKKHSTPLPTAEPKEVEAALKPSIEVADVPAPTST